MDEAKPPDESRDWKSLDIFIFSNGQQLTPPRKYHLRSDELKFWEPTLRFLARSLYGSQISAIELYSIEGKRLEGPLELCNDVAYVAVRPPDPFIQSGYDKYLLKASRSWEKRQGKKLNNLNPTEDKKFGLATMKVHKISKDNTILTAERNKGKLNNPIKHTSAVRPNSCISTITKSPIEKRKVLNPRNNVLRKLNNSGKLSNMTQFSKGKVTSSTKNSHPISKETLNNYMSVKNKLITDAFLETKSSESNKKDPKQGNEISINMNDNNNSIKTEHSKVNISLNNNIEDVIRQKIVYQNLESEPKSLFVDAEKGSRTNKDNEPRSPHASPFNSIGVKEDTNNYYINTRTISPEHDKEIKNNTEVETQKNNANQNFQSGPNSLFVDADKGFRTVTSNHPRSSHALPLNINEMKTNNYNVNTQSMTCEQDNEMKNNAEAETQKSTVSIPENLQNRQIKECTINFNLNIEVKDCKIHSMYSDTISKNYHFTTEKQSQTNLQIDLDKEVIKTNDNNYLDAMNPLVRNSCLGCENKVIIVRCSCNDNTNNNSALENNVNSKKCVILLPQEENISDRGEDLKLQKYHDCKEKEGATNATYMEPQNLVIREDVNNKMNIVKEHQVSISTCYPSNCESLAKLSKNHMDTENANKVNSMPTSTQTEWCNTLVEARCNEDGSYSFHLPSIEKLKEFKL